MQNFPISEGYKIKIANGRSAELRMKIKPSKMTVISSQVNDIAIITLKSSLKWTNNVGPICLPPDNTFENREAVIIGWGLLDYRKYGVCVIFFRSGR